MKSPLPFFFQRVALLIPSLLPSLRVATLTRLAAPIYGRPAAAARHLAGASQIDQRLPNPLAANTEPRGVTAVCHSLSQ
jgi:hypothetical protein